MACYIPRYVHEADNAAPECGSSLRSRGPAFTLSFPAVAQNLTPEELLAKARDAVRPSLIGPHHLEAQVTVLLADGKKGKGTYSLDWAAPDRFREELHLPDYDEIGIASGTSLYRKRSLDYIPERVFELEELMNPTAALDEAQRNFSRLIADNISRAKSGGKTLATQLTESKVEFGRRDAVCVSLLSAVPEVCVDARHGWPLEITEDDIEMDEDLEFDDYSSLKGVRISRNRQFVENGAVTVEARVKKLASVRNFDTSAFTPPAGADQIPWCYDMVPAVRLAIKAPATISSEDFPEPEFLYGLVRADGTVEKISIIATSGAGADADIRTIANSIRFTPATCGGKPVNSEARFIVSDMDFISADNSEDVPEGGAKGFTQPSCENCPTPPFTDRAFHRKLKGRVIMSVIVGTDGRAHHVRITQRLGLGLDESALRTVRNLWRFKPATGPDGKAAAVHMLIEVDFNIY
ncbi:MAG TPA: energy transducer TonB [Candidatus Acidoferrales bacterium]|nr:energy transducer TonB [Candidatus Acidoferrales bacterium]